MIDGDDFEYFSAYSEPDEVCHCLQPYLSDYRCEICGGLWAPEDYSDDEY